MDDGGLSIDEPGIEVTLKHDKDALDTRIGCRLVDRESCQGFWQEGATYSKNGRFNEVATLHEHLKER
jgi:hypothetical protein